MKVDAKTRRMFAAEMAENAYHNIMGADGALAVAVKALVSTGYSPESYAALAALVLNVHNLAANAAKAAQD